MPSRNKQTDNPSSHSALPAGLYVVATPIGNLGDITLRALETLKAAQLIACEDTRVTTKLLTHYGIRGPLISYHDHNTEAAGGRIRTEIESGKAVALVSDAGTPLISDPGFPLVRLLTEAGLPVFPIPGVSALTTALMGAGVPSDRVLFSGFLPAKQAARRTAIADIAGIPATHAFYESPRRLAEALADMAELLGASRQGVVARELTKLHEEFRRGTLAELAAHYASAAEPKGEVVLLVGPPEEGAERWSESEVEFALRESLRTLRVKEAAAFVAAQSGWPKKELYARALLLKGEGGKA